MINRVDPPYEISINSRDWDGTGLAFNTNGSGGTSVLPGLNSQPDPYRHIRVGKSSSGNTVAFCDDPPGSTDSTRLWLRGGTARIPITPGQQSSYDTMSYLEPKISSRSSTALELVPVLSTGDSVLISGSGSGFYLSAAQDSDFWYGLDPDLSDLIIAAVPKGYDLTTRGVLQYNNLTDTYGVPQVNVKLIPFPTDPLPFRTETFGGSPPPYIDVDLDQYLRVEVTRGERVNLELQRDFSNFKRIDKCLRIPFRSIEYLYYSATGQYRFFFKEAGNTPLIRLIGFSPLPVSD